MGLLQKQPGDRTLYLTLAGVPAANVTYDTVTCGYRKSGQWSFQAKVLASTDWVDLGNGYYVIKFSAAELDTLGSFSYKLTAAGFDSFSLDQFTVIPGQPLLPPNLCVVSGRVNQVDGDPVQDIRVTARLLDFPARAGTIVLSGNIVQTYPDANGTFSFRLIQGAQVWIEIERTGVRYQITVPYESSANLIDLLPPFDNAY